jgi:hypothetical protein
MKIIPELMETFLDKYVSKYYIGNCKYNNSFSGL